MSYKIHIYIYPGIMNSVYIRIGKKKSLALQALTNLGRLSSRRWQSFPTAPDWVDMWSAHRIPQLHFQPSKPDRYFFIQVTTQFIRSRG
jgi:hypothetical protein